MCALFSLTVRARVCVSVCTEQACILWSGGGGKPD